MMVVPTNFIPRRFRSLEICRTDRYWCENIIRIQNDFPIRKAPEIAVKRAKLLLDGKEHPSILDGGLDLGPVADNPGVGHQSLHLLWAVSGHHCRFKAVKGGTKRLPFFKW